MQGIYRRPTGGNLLIAFTDPTGRRVRCSAGTKDPKQAAELRDKLKAEAWRTARLGERPRYVWQQAVVRWIGEHEHKATLDRDRQTLRRVAHLLDNRALNEITADDLEAVAAFRADMGVGPAAVNRTLQCLRAILRAAVRWGWIDYAPAVRLRREPSRRVRWLTAAEAARLLKELPAHLALMCRFSLATGLRESNVCGLRWAQIDLSRRAAWIHPDESKNRRALAVPLNDDAVSVLRECTGQHSDRVFTYRGQPVSRCNTLAWRKALLRAGINDFRWHDLRHTWASWHVQAGTPLHVLQELGGWATPTMVQRYAHLSSEHLLAYSQGINNSSPSGAAFAAKIRGAQ